jgi:hypothetical protein
MIPRAIGRPQPPQSLEGGEEILATASPQPHRLSVSRSGGGTTGEDKERDLVAARVWACPITHEGGNATGYVTHSVPFFSPERNSSPVTLFSSPLMVLSRRHLV